MNYNYLIIDTDVVSQLQLKLFFAEYDDFRCIANINEIREGLDSILKFLPDIVLLNLEDDAAEQFKMVCHLNQYMEEPPLLIGYATTEKYAYQALTSGFFDYWLLPHTEFKLRKSIFKLRKKLPKEQTPVSICLKSYSDYHYVNTKDILYLQADNNATHFVLKGETKITSYKTLKSFERMLPPGFVRVHQSYILNSRYISRINYGKSICTIKEVNQNLPFSKNYRSKVDFLKQQLSKTALDTFK